MHNLCTNRTVPTIPISLACLRLETQVTSSRKYLRVFLGKGKTNPLIHEARFLFGFGHIHLMYCIPARFPREITQKKYVPGKRARQQHRPSPVTLLLTNDCKHDAFNKCIQSRQQEEIHQHLAGFRLCFFLLCLLQRGRKKPCHLATLG